MAEELDSYYKELEDMLKGTDYDSKPNDERFHNAQITRLFLEEGGHIRMYCGEMSVFRKDFYNHIKEERDAKTAEYARNGIKESLKKFFENPENRLEIVLAKPLRYSDLNDLLCESLFFSHKDTSILSIKTADSRLLMTGTLDHFMFSDRRMLRYEEAPEEHSGFFATNLPDDFFEEIKDTYRVIDEGSVPIAY